MNGTRSSRNVASRRWERGCGSRDLPESGRRAATSPHHAAAAKGPSETRGPAPTHRRSVILLALLLGVTAAHAQTAPTPAQLDSLVAPIALYPDALVAHILPASTYPVEVVEAARDLANGGTPAASDMNSWDPSIQALVSVPSVLKMMNDRLSWTTQLGQAVSQSQQAVMAAIQRVRAKAQSAGNLSSNSHQTVTTQGQTIIIQPANPEVIYVPQYDPVAILEPAPLWVTPDYGLMTFGAGFTAGIFTAYACHWGGGWGWGWGGGPSITVNNNYHYTTRTNVNVNSNDWNSWKAPRNVGRITNTYPGATRPVDQGQLGGGRRGDQWGDDGGRRLGDDDGRGERLGDGGGGERLGGDDRLGDGFGGQRDGGGRLGDGFAGRDDGFGSGGFGDGGGFRDDGGFRGVGDGWGARDASDRGFRSFGDDGGFGGGFGGGGFGRDRGGWGGWGGGGGRGFGGFGGGRGRR